ncbi:MAG: geranylgeranylglycerol-phosphate geranylgeranyltransferase [Ignavibacteriales bacterium]|nr:geranylgeranylglycerol-phosphate geranylgeranyltransferase [Ignavibacteriales bacterium]
MNLSKKINAFIKITRPVNVVITFLVVVVAILISQENNIEFYKIIFPSIVVALVAAAGNIINDINDVETDKISHPERVLVLESLSKKEAIYFYNFLNILAIIIASRLSDILLLIVFGSIIILYFYSYSLKKFPLLGNVTVASLTGLTFIYGGFVTGNPIAAIAPAVFAFLINLVREIVKDIQDIEGDSIIGYKTFPIKYGIQKSKFLILVITVSLILYTVYPFITKLYKIEYFLIVMLIVNPVLILSIKLLYDKEKNRFKIISNLLKVDMIFGLLAIYLGK